MAGLQLLRWVPIRIGEQKSSRVGWKICLEGGVMDITPVDRAAAVPAPAANTAPVDKAAENREVVQAVKALNGTEMFGDNELDFQRDPQTRRMVVRVVNRKTQEVISQVPPEYVLRLAESMKQTKA